MRAITDTSDTLQWMLSDHLGSTSTTANADGSWNSSISYTAFGEVRARSGLTASDFRYTGQLRQAELGLYYYVARWYDPQTAHFTQADTMVPNAGDAASYDRYTYVRNNPVRYEDPSGHRPCNEIENGRCVAEPGWNKIYNITPIVTRKPYGSFTSTAQWLKLMSVTRTITPFSTPTLNKRSTNLPTRNSSTPTKTPTMTPSWTPTITSTATITPTSYSPQNYPTNVPGATINLKSLIGVSFQEILNEFDLRHVGQMYPLDPLSPLDNIPDPYVQTLVQTIRNTLHVTVTTVNTFRDIYPEIEPFLSNPAYPQVEPVPYDQDN